MRPLLVCSPRRVANIASSNNQEEEYDLHEEPCPATARLWWRRFPSSSATRGGAAGRLRGVEILGVDGDDIVVVAQFTSLGGETQVSNRRNSDVGVFGVKVEALDPGILGLVLKFQGEGLVLEVSETGFGGNGGVTETASLNGGIRIS